MDFGGATPGGKAKEMDDSSRAATAGRKKIDLAFRLEVLQPMQTLFSEAVAYHTYRLKNKFQLYDSKITSRFAELVSRLRSQRKETDYDGMVLISILALLKKFRNFCANIDIR